MSPRPDELPMEADSEGNLWLLCAPRRKGLHPPSPTTPTISPFALRAMAAGIVSAARYKTGLRLAKHRIPYTSGSGRIADAHPS